MNCHSNGCVQQSQLFTHLFKLLQALNFFVYHVPFVDKQIALWAQGLVHLTLIWHHGEHTFSGKELKAKFKNISLHPSNSHRNITYVRLPISFHSTNKCNLGISRLTASTFTLAALRKDFLKENGTGLASTNKSHKSNLCMLSQRSAIGQETTLFTNTLF